MRYTWNDEAGRTHHTVAGPGVSTDDISPDYPRQMMATHQACCICWKDCQNGESVYETETGRPAHADCLEWSVVAIKTR